MYAIQKGRDQQQPKCQPNILPCRINHSGIVNTSTRYWTPTVSEDGTSVSYFRGRKLHGKTVEIPKGYKGVILSSTEQKIPKEPQVLDGEDVELDEDEQREDIEVLEKQAEFDEVIIWGHEALPDEATDPYGRGVKEWISFAEQIHSYPPSQESEAQK